MQANVHQLANQGCMQHIVKHFSIVQEYCTDVLASLQKLGAGHKTRIHLTRSTSFEPISFFLMWYH